MRTNFFLWFLVCLPVFALDKTGPLLHLKIGSFDPLISQANDRFPQGESLYLVQFQGKTQSEYFDAIRDLGGRVGNYIPNRTYIVRMDNFSAAKVQKLNFVRWVGLFHPDYKMPKGMEIPKKPMHYDLVLFDRADLPRLLNKANRLSTHLAHMNLGSSVITLELHPDQVLEALKWPETSWLEPHPGTGEDVDNARVQGGATALPTKGIDPTFTGIGIKGHVFEGISPDHPDFAANKYRQKPISVLSSMSSSHGHQTYGIIFGSGAGKKEAQGFLPNAQGYFTAYDDLMEVPAGQTKEKGRYALVKGLMAQNQVMFQTASWGYDRTTQYDARSAEMDEIIFDLDIPITQSQSNSGDQMSRPQAWAKNVISIGAVNHYNNSDHSDDEWDYGASIGPAADGRIKPELCAYYDDIMTTDLTGYTSSFGGTSGATPIVAGHMGLMIEMWTEGAFGNELRHPRDQKFLNRPKFTTTKALLINTASQYHFTGEDHDLTRMHQGWGFPNLKRAYEAKQRMQVVDETDILKQDQVKTYTYEVPADADELNITLVYADPAASVTAAIARINDFDIEVLGPKGERYWGNHGLLVGTESVQGGQPDSINTVENVLLKHPSVGTWTVRVIAREINLDGHKETPALDGDYALVVSWPRIPTPS